MWLKAFVSLFNILVLCERTMVSQRRYCHVVLLLKNLGNLEHLSLYQHLGYPTHKLIPSHMFERRYFAHKLLLRQKIFRNQTCFNPTNTKTNPPKLYKIRTPAISTKPTEVENRAQSATATRRKPNNGHNNTQTRKCEKRKRKVG